MAFSDEDLKKIWARGKSVEGFNSLKYRQDACGAWMEYSKYGDRDSTYGWEVDHIDPNGGNFLSNLRPLQWENNVAKSDGKLKCVVTSKNNGNVNVNK